ncbi:aldo/keto reductase [Terrarubrum flagellatum]|uniref:aldo/keto reductase n=1 Tax=Terrirubrum flagellatum TaxID=2895980 RepID=UPI003144E9AC
MDFRTLGRSDVKVSAICLGTMTWGQQNTEAEGHAQMDMAVDHGVTMFDTAERYSIPPKPETQGSTERIIGNWFKSRGKRDKIVLASKVAGRSDDTYMRNPPAPARVTRKQINEAVEGSLKRLQTDYLDLYQIHAPDRPAFWGSNPTQFRVNDFKPASDETPFEEQLGALDDLVKAGKIRFVGLSNESPWGVMKFLQAHETKNLARVQTIQNSYNLLNRTFETGLAEVWLREQVGLLAYSPLGQGYLTGKYLDGARPAGTRTTLFNRGQRYEKPGVDDAIRDYVALARDLKVEPAALAIAFVTSRPFLTSNIIGATSLDQLKIILSSLEVRITREIESRIDAIHQVRGNPAP